MEKMTGANKIGWGMVVLLGIAYAYAAWKVSPFVVLAPYIALLTVKTVDRWAERFGSRPKAVAAMVALLFGFVISLSLMVGLIAVPLVKLAHQFPDLVKIYLPQAQKLVDDLEAKLNAYHLFEKDFDVALSSLVHVFSTTFTEGGSALPHVLGTLLSPLLVMAEGLIVLVLVGFFLGYWPSCWNGLQKHTEAYLPAAWPWVENITAELQTIGRGVAWGYIAVVCILTPLTFLALLVLSFIYTGAAEIALVNLALVSLCFGFISAMPGVGTKLGLALIVLVGLVLFGFSVQVSVVMTIIGLVITTVESKLLTPKLMGKALGLNPAVILTVALSSILLGGVSGALWTMFFGLPLVVAVNRVYMAQVAPEKDENT